MAKTRPVLLLARELGIGGCERDLARTAIGLDRSRFEPHVGCFRPGGFRFQELIAAGIPVNCFPVESLIRVSGVSEAIAVRRYVRRNGIELIHAFDAPTSIFAAPVAKSLRIRVIAANLWFRDKIPPRLHRGLRFIDRIVDTVIVNSNAVREHLIRDENVPAARIHLCYNGVDTVVFYPQRDPRAGLVVGSVCALRPETRLDLLVEAFTKVRQFTPGMKLLVVGSGEMLPQLKGLTLGRDSTTPACSSLQKLRSGLDAWHGHIRSAI
jgi:glycosyltransferase involved in cell wall biosynthesis